MPTPRARPHLRLPPGLLLLGLSLAASPAAANGLSLRADSPATNFGVGPGAPLDGARMAVEPDVACQTERLEIELRREEARVEVDYTYLNHGADKTLTYGFPFVLIRGRSARGGDWLAGKPRRYSLEVDGREVESRFVLGGPVPEEVAPRWRARFVRAGFVEDWKQAAPEDTRRWGFFASELRFPAGRPVRVRVRYAVDTLVTQDPLGRERVFSYLLSTGGAWRGGRIGRLEVVLTARGVLLPELEGFRRAGDSLVREQTDLAPRVADDLFIPVERDLRERLTKRLSVFRWLHRDALDVRGPAPMFAPGDLRPVPGTWTLPAAGPRLGDQRVDLLLTRGGVRVTARYSLVSPEEDAPVTLGVPFAVLVGEQPGLGLPRGFRLTAEGQALPTRLLVAGAAPEPGALPDDLSLCLGSREGVCRGVRPARYRREYAAAELVLPAGRPVRLEARYELDPLAEHDGLGDSLLFDYRLARGLRGRPDQGRCLVTVRAEGVTLPPPELVGYGLRFAARGGGLAADCAALPPGVHRVRGRYFADQAESAAYLVALARVREAAEGLLALDSAEGQPTDLEDLWLHLFQCERARWAHLRAVDPEPFQGEAECAPAAE
ncbi:MAG TPA: hypothetical protein PK668_02740 [Myxococcota bacterium]|nr:hypothetical protein [Myxococcota bacterium]HRY94512.1 hypothetical protein [Myxococcota bacterium]HSA20011.1 hypothetical protein [Myxococcota bacterium]